MNAVPSFTPSFATGMNPMYAQQMPMSRTPVIAKSKPLTLSSLGVGKIGGGAAKSISRSPLPPRLLLPPLLLLLLRLQLPLPLL